MTDQQPGYRDLARLAFANGLALLEDSELLMRERRHARAASLAVIGVEEVGKAILFSLVATGTVPNLRVSIQSIKGNPALDHQFKQVVVEIVRVVEWQVEDYLEALSDMAAGEPVAPDPVFPLMLLLNESATAIAKRQKEDGTRAGRRYFRSLKDSLTREEDEGGVSGEYETLEELKWRGLYVPVAANQEGPETVTRADAGYQVDELRQALGVVGPLEAGLADDVEWEELSERLKRYREAVARPDLEEAHFNKAATVPPVPLLQTLFSQAMPPPVITQCGSERPTEKAPFPL